MEVIVILNAIIYFFIKDGLILFDLSILIVFLGMFLRNSLHPRYFIRFIFFFSLFVLISNFIYVGLIKLDYLSTSMSLFLIFLFYEVIAFSSARKPILISKIKLEQLKKIINQGLWLDREDLFLKKPFFLVDFTEIYSYKILLAAYNIERGDLKRAYELYCSIDEGKLFKKEKEELTQKKSYVIGELGNVTKANFYIDLLHDKNDLNDPKEPDYFLLKASVSEKAGDISGSLTYLQKALNRIPEREKASTLKTIIFNNYGRIRKMQNNYLDAIKFFDKSRCIAKNLGIKSLIHASYQNLIHYYIQEHRIDQAKTLYEEYETLIDLKSTNDLLEIYNFRLEYARQCEDRKSIESSIVNGYEVLKEKLIGNKKLCLDVSQLRIMLNNGIMNNKILNTVFANIDSYFNMEMPYRIFALKEIYFVIRNLNFQNESNFAPVFSKIDYYMKTNAMTELEDYINSLEDFEVYERCYMETEKVGVMKEHIKPYDFQRVYGSLACIKDIYFHNGLILEAIRIDLNIADECLSPENFDGFNFKIPQSLTILKEHVTFADENLNKIKFNPAFSEFYLRLAAYYFAMKDDIRSKFYFNEFQKCKISINHYANWLQNYYKFLHERFG